MVRKALAAGLAIFAAGAVAASAETWKGLDLQKRIADAPWRFGPFKIQPSLVISNAGVDSNVFYSPSDPVKDYTVTAGPAATVYLPIHRRFVLSVQGSPQYVWYSKTEQERTWNYYLGGAAQLSLKNVFLSLEGSYSDARERWNTEIDIRPRRKEEGFGGSLLVNLAHRTSVSFAGRTAKYDYESVVYGDDFDVRERLNRRESYGNLSFYYQATSQRRFFLDFEYGEYRFDFERQAAVSDARSRPGAVASFYVFRFLRLDYDYSRGRNRYPLVGGGGPDEKRRDDFEIHSGGLYVRIRKTVALGFIASWWTRDSNLDAEDDKRTFFGVNLTYDF